MTNFALETETKEFKKSLAELKAGLISLCAMLNKHGKGELWFGISPKGEAVGMEISEKTLRDVSQAIAAHIEPAIYPQVSLEIVQNKPCLKVVASGQQQPYFAYGRAYMRVADEDKKLSAQELKQLILQENREALRWEDEPCSLAVKDLSADKINSFLARAGLPSDNPDSALAKLDLLKNGQPINAAKLFFANQPIKLRCAVFATDTSSTIIDQHDFEGDLLELIAEAEKYILKHIRIGMRLKGLEREDVPEIPTAATREAVINAFCHRDWRDPDFVQVAIFRDRLEVRNPGKLYDELTIAEIRQGNVSRRRNPKIAALLHRIRYIEAWGRGVPLILEKAPDAEFKEFGSLFIARFKREELEAIPEDGLGISEKHQRNTKETPSKRQVNTRETPSKHQDASGQQIGNIKQNLRETLLEILQAQPEHSVRSLAEMLGTTTDSVRHHLRRLQEQGRLRHVGPTKNGYWEIVGNDED